MTWQLLRTLQSACFEKKFFTPEFNNQPYRPAFDVPNPDSEFRDFTGIDVLHTFPLGVTTDVITALEVRYEKEMNKFFAETKQRKELGAQPGGKWR